MYHKNELVKTVAAIPRSCLFRGLPAALQHQRLGSAAPPVAKDERIPMYQAGEEFSS